ncbi:EamA family transporter RarD, partial [Brevibacterium paucivorans]
MTDDSASSPIQAAAATTPADGAATGTPAASTALPLDEAHRRR